MSDPLRLLDTLKTTAAALLSAGVPFAVAGGTAAYARGAAPPFHDVDLVIMESDVPEAVKALLGAGMRIEDPPEDWLIKAFDEDRMVDLISGTLTCIRPLREQADWDAVPPSSPACRCRWSPCSATTTTSATSRRRSPRCCPRRA